MRLEANIGKLFKTRSSQGGGGILGFNYFALGPDSLACKGIKRGFLSIACEVFSLVFM